MQQRWLLSMLTALAVSGASAQTVANGPYYATPAWDQTLPSTTRFIVLSNMNSDAVLDRETGLVWQRTSNPGIFTWSSAIVHCLQVATGGRFAWRLPTIHELGSLFDPTSTLPQFLPTGHPFLGLGAVGTFWSISRTPDGAIRTLFYEPIAPAGNILDVARPKNPSEGGSAWCVRGGGHASTQ